MKRRDFMGMVGASAVLGASTAFAQVTRKPARIGVLSSGTPEARQEFWGKFKEGMAALGWVEGRDVVYIYRYTQGDSSRFDALAKELVAEKPDLIFAGTQLAAMAAKRASRTIPIVFAFVSDPIHSGLAASLARPGGNATGLSNLTLDVSAKYLELLKDIQPRLRSVAVVTSTPSGPRRERSGPKCIRCSSRLRRPTLPWMPLPGAAPTASCISRFRWSNGARSPSAWQSCACRRSTRSRKL